MSSTLTLSAPDCKSLLHLYRHPSRPEQAPRAHLLLLLDPGYTWATIANLLFTSTSTLARWQRRFQAGGLDAVVAPPPTSAPWFARSWAQLVAHWVTQRSPRDFGFLRSRWTCATVTWLLLAYFEWSVSRATVRRWLHQSDLVWRRPRPVLHRQDPDRSVKLWALRQLLARWPADEVAVFQDEVDINLNPKIGSMWMQRGRQAEVETPGDNEKRYVAGSMNWRTGALWVTEGTRRDGALFVRHLEDLRHRLRRYRVIHVISDNAHFHRAEKCKRLQESTKRWGHRIVLH